MIRFNNFIKDQPVILTEGSIYERMRRYAGIPFDDLIATAGLIYDAASRHLLEQVHASYLNIGQKHHLPMILQTDTWRASSRRIHSSQFWEREVDQDNVRFVKAIRTQYPAVGPEILIAGLLGPDGDAYKPEEAPDEVKAMQLHQPQVQALVESGVDLMLAATLPALPEALGIAKVIGQTRAACILSFVLRSSGTLLDGTPLSDAIEKIDREVNHPPLGYAINCVHPSVILEGLTQSEMQARGMLPRVLGFQANASAKRPEELDGLLELDSDDPERLAKGIWSAHCAFGIKLLGGCCGTDERHMEALALAISNGSPKSGEP